MIGLDTNILVYSLDPTFPEHDRAKKAILSSGGCAVNSTVIHETYHTLVFRRKISPIDSRRKLVEFLADRRMFFINMTKVVSLFAMNLAVKTKLGGRDSLIVGCYLHNRISEMYSHDDDLVKLKKLSMKERTLRIIDPIT
jgi:predicted nucleic acid-binding protein